MSGALFDLHRFARIFNGTVDQVLDLSGYLDKGDFVGGGSYGDVYEGKWIQSKTDGLAPLGQLPIIAVKVMRVPPLRDLHEKEKRLKKLTRELRVWQRLRHDNILPLVGMAILDGNMNLPSLISPWMANGTVKEYLKAHPDAPILDILVGVANGLVYLHLFNPRIAHGDLKADNILVDLRGIPYLCDFGMSRMLEDSTLWITTATQAGGTLRWTAPELMSGEVTTVTVEGDVYAFAMTSLEIVTKEVPFVELRNDAAVVSAVSLHDRRPDRPKHDLIDDSLWGLWTKCWATKPNTRPSMTEVVKHMATLSPSMMPKVYIESYQEAYPAAQQTRVSVVDARKPVRLKSQEAHSPENSFTWDILNSLPEEEVTRQRLISKAIKNEERYQEDFRMLEEAFLTPLESQNPPVIETKALEVFIDAVFGRIFKLRDHHASLLYSLQERQKEDGLVIHQIGDVFLDGASSSRDIYRAYLREIPTSRQRVEREFESNLVLRRFMEFCASRTNKGRNLFYFLTLPRDHLAEFIVTIDGIIAVTKGGSPDAKLLEQTAIFYRNLSYYPGLLDFQQVASPRRRLEWVEFVAEEQIPRISKQEIKRQGIIWEFITLEKLFIEDLQLISEIFVEPLRSAKPPIIPAARIGNLIWQLFHSYEAILNKHRTFLNSLQELQLKEHPFISSLASPILKASSALGDLHVEYSAHHPFASYYLEMEMSTNEEFKKFVDNCVRHPKSRKLDIKSFILMPVTRFLRYIQLLESMMNATPSDHQDRLSIPPLIETLKAYGNLGQDRIVAAKQKVDLWRIDDTTLPSVHNEMLDLRNSDRRMIFSGTVMELSSSAKAESKLRLVLLDNYLIVLDMLDSSLIRASIPLSRLRLSSFTDPPRGQDYRWPFTVCSSGLSNAFYTFYTRRAAGRMEWKRKFDEALTSSFTDHDGSKIYELLPITARVFHTPHGIGEETSANKNHSKGRINCTCPFLMSGGRKLVAIGSTTGLWVQQRDSHSLTRVLDLNVTQCHYMQELDIFLILANQTLMAYNVVALVRSRPDSTVETSAQILSGSHKVLFFSVGILSAKTLVIYARQKGADYILKALEPIPPNISTRSKPTFGRLRLGSQNLEWFKTFREFFLPVVTFDIMFLRTMLVLLTLKGIEILDLIEFKNGTLTLLDNPRMSDIAHRLDSSKALGMYRVSDDEFLLCFDEFGIYVDKLGDPCRPNSEITVDWKGVASRSALDFPYLLLFDSRFIEVRHVVSGELLQILPGAQIRCTWDSRPPDSLMPVSPPDHSEEEAPPSPENIVHCVMESTTNLDTKDEWIIHAQDLFQLHYIGSDS